jgi:hypothetical protein
MNTVIPPPPPPINTVIPPPPPINKIEIDKAISDDRHKFHTLEIMKETKNKINWGSYNQTHFTGSIYTDKKGKKVKHIVVCVVYE